MGGHYGSVQLHTDDRQRVKQAAEQVAQAKGIKCLVGPALNGWVGVYPQNNGQDEKVGEQIARRVGGEAIHLLVHDDDIFAYWFWRDGKLIDSFWSKPGYFGKENLEAEEAMAGKPEVFAHLVGNRLEELRKLLDRDEDYVFEYERLMQFGELLGIGNTVTAYEYLKDGEIDDIEDWKNFEEIPAEAVGAGRPARQQPKHLQESDTKKLRGAGLLLHDRHDEWRTPLACSIADGLLVVWSPSATPGNDRGIRFEKFAAPWTQPTDPGISIRGTVNAVASDRAGKRVALSLGGQIVVIEGPPWKTILEITEREWAAKVAMSADGKLVAHCSHQETVITAVDTDRRLLAWGTSYDNLFFHPAGEWLFSSGKSLAVAEVRPQFSLRQLTKPGGKVDESDKTLTEPAAGSSRCVGFSHNGKELFLATAEEIQIYDWDSVIFEGRSKWPDPLRTIQIPRPMIELTDGRSVLSPPDVKAATLDSQDVIILGSLNGRISLVRPGQTKVHETISVPRDMIFDLLLSYGDVALGVMSIDRGSEEHPGGHVWRIWSYRRLLENLT